MRCIESDDEEEMFGLEPATKPPLLSPFGDAGNASPEELPALRCAKLSDDDAGTAEGPLLNDDGDGIERMLVTAERLLATERGFLRGSLRGAGFSFFSFFSLFSRRIFPASARSLVSR